MQSRSLSDMSDMQSRSMSDKVAKLFLDEEKEALYGKYKKYKILLSCTFCSCH